MSDKVIVVTGGTKGIGKAISKTFIKGGYKLITCARDKVGLENLKEEFGSRVIPFQADLSVKEEVYEFISFIKSKTKHIDVLVNNTGTFTQGLLHNEDDSVLEKLIQTNLYSAYYLTKGVLDLMMKSKSADIFNICSTASKMAYTNGGAYCVSKFALYGFSKVLREELKEKGVRVISVLPGATFTNSWEGVDLPEDRFIDTNDVSETIWCTVQLSRRTVIEEIVLRPQLGDI